MTLLGLNGTAQDRIGQDRTEYKMNFFFVIYLGGVVRLWASFIGICE